MSHRPKHLGSKKRVPIDDGLSHIALLAKSSRLTIRLKCLDSSLHASSQLELLVFGAYGQKLLSASLSLQCSVLRASRLLKAHGVLLVWNQEQDTFGLVRKEYTHTLIDLILGLTEYQPPHKDRGILN